jgi:hypothetical protein
MTVTDFLLPAFVEVLLIFILMGLMGRARLGSIARGETKREDIALESRNYPDDCRKYANCFSNQFELPTLFFVLIGFILITRAGDVLLLVLAWVFVLSRLAHAYIHTTSNNVDRRFTAYALGALALFVMWVVFAVKILTGA